EAASLMKQRRAKLDPSDFALGLRLGLGAVLFPAIDHRQKQRDAKSGIVFWSPAISGADLRIPEARVDLAASIKMFGAGRERHFRKRTRLHGGGVRDVMTRRE